MGFHIELLKDKSAMLANLDVLQELYPSLTAEPRLY